MKERPKNWWMVGYRAAMRADVAELTEAGERAALERALQKYEGGPVGEAAFRAGWRSVLRCERADEVAS